MIEIIFALLLVVLIVALVVKMINPFRSHKPSTGVVKEEQLTESKTVVSQRTKDILAAYSRKAKFGTANELSKELSWVKKIPYGWLSSTCAGTKCGILGNFLKEQKINFGTEDLTILRYPRAVLLQEAYISRNDNIAAVNVDDPNDLLSFMPMAQVLINHLVDQYQLEIALAQVTVFMKSFFNPSAILAYEECIASVTQIPDIHAASGIKQLDSCKELEPYFAKVQKAVYSGCADKHINASSM